MTRSSSWSISRSLLRSAREVLRDLDADAGGVTGVQDMARRLLAEIDRARAAKELTDSDDDAWSRLRNAFFAADDGIVNARQQRIDRLARLAGLYEKLNQADGVGAIYTPVWMADLMAQRTLTTKVAAILNVNPTRIDTLFRVGDCDNVTVELPSKRLATDALDVLRGLTITDPACGCGALLLAITQSVDRLVRNTKPRNGQWRAAFLNNLSGYDIDPVAVDVSRARLAVWAGIDHDDPALNNIMCKDALNTDTDNMPVDVCIMNPPYVPTYSRRSDARVAATVNAYAQAHRLKGRLNLFGCFMHRSLEITRTDGVICAIVPDTFGSATAYEPLRAVWHQRFEQVHWLTVANNVFNAQVGSVVVTAGPAKSTAVALQADELTSIEPIELRPRAPAIAKDGRLLLFRSQTEQHIWRAVQDQSARFDEFVRSRDGVNTGPRYMRDILLDPQHIGPTVTPLIEGEDIAPIGYQLNAVRRSIDYNPNLIDAAARRAGASLRDPEIFNRPKVVTRQTADTLIAAVEPHGGIVALNSVHCHQLLDAPDYLLWGLCAWLNAPLTRLYYALDGGEQRKVLPQVRIAWLRQLPIPCEFLKCLRELAPLARIVATASPAKAQRAHDHIHTITCTACGLRDKAEAVWSAYHDRFPRFATAPSKAITKHDASAA